MHLTDRPADATAPHQLSAQERAGDDLLARALRRARWTIFWERLWPALASAATVIGLFLALSWLGVPAIRRGAAAASVASGAAASVALTAPRRRA